MDHELAHIPVSARRLGCPLVLTHTAQSGAEAVGNATISFVNFGHG